MRAHNWITRPALMWLVTCCLHLGIGGQSENAIGAHRVFEKTSFSCAGRPAGYYADIETGCQVYHMCDGLGRQFSYSCPNTTLFQQRMLICDHWYMVNCSKAESHYAANLLIGQRDKPFVDDEENSLRTPRPDLLDRPYAPDYSGESFRNQYKQTAAPQNQILDSTSQKKIAEKTSQVAAGQQRWKLPPPSRTILPPAYESQSLEETSTKPTTRQQSSTGSVLFVATTKAPTRASGSSSATTKTTREPTSAATRKQTSAGNNNAALLQRQQESLHSAHDDLGTSHSTRYNTSADFNSAEAAPRKSYSTYNIRKAYTVPATTTSTTKQTIKVPSKIYEPPFVYPIYNQDDTPSTETPLTVSSAAPFVASTATRTITSATTTKQPLSRPTTLAGKPFTVSSYSITTTSAPTLSNAGRNQNNLVQSTYQQSPRFDSQKLAKEARTPTPAQGFKPPTPRPPVHSAKTLKPPATAQSIEVSAFDYKVPTTSRLNLPTPVIPSDAPNSLLMDLPAKELLPPFKEFVQHDIATTQGPPIYYEWKVPSNGLEPPKLDPPIGVDGREYPDGVLDYNNISATGGFASSDSFGLDQQKTSASVKTPVASSNPFLPSKYATNEISTTRTPTVRSIKETGQPNSISRPVATKTSTTTNTRTQAGATPTVSADITELRRELSVPDYAFPLENIGRTGYLATDTYNSFQLKIPERRSDNDDHQHWFGENPHCPECHPSYVIPGTCKPCLRR